MNVKLSIEEDDDLRSYIKDCIKGQVLSITREEYNSIIKEEINKKFMATGEDYILRLMRQEMEPAIRNVLYTSCNVSRWNAEFVYPIATPIIIEAVSHAVQNIDWEGEIKSRVREAVKDLLKVAE